VRKRNDFDKSVFVNCPFDDDFAPLLQAIVFCLVDCGLQPRLATERGDSSELRLNKILELMKASKYAIHDLSRMAATEVGELSRMNMPFELGVDFGLAEGSKGILATKEFLVLGEERYEYQAAISDIAGWDIMAHGGEYSEAIRVVRKWLASKPGLNVPAASQIEGNYVGFMEWDIERHVDWSLTDLNDRPTVELLDSMQEWLEAGRPMTA